jgi:arabinofuranan 3-O-arabinosyltransferase
MSDPATVLRFLLRPATRCLICWVIALADVAFVAEQAWNSYNDGKRLDGNNGHATIDFGGQWIMGRTLATGHGRHLYQRHYLRRIAEENYPTGVENPEQDKSDVACLMDWLSGTDDDEAPKVVASLFSPLAASNALDGTILFSAARPEWTEEQLTHVTAPRLGGALYPPVHALMYAPLALLPPPLAYRVMQGFILFLVFFLGWLAQRLTQGRVWQPVAMVFVTMIPGFSGCIALGQNGIITLAIVLFGWWQLMRGRQVAAGLCWSLLAFKPVWALAFLLVPLVTARWRMAAGMAAGGGAWIAATLPFVGWRMWLDWLRVGQMAAQEYRRQENWIFLSRDLLGIPRRWLLTFEDHLAKDLVWRIGAPHVAADGSPENPWDHRLLSGLGWGLWLAVFGTTLFVAWRSRRRRQETTGIFPAFVLIGAIFSCYHFLYYDFIVAGLPLLLLFTEPSRYFQARFWRGQRPPLEMQRYYQPDWNDPTPPPMPLLPQGRRPRWVMAPIPPLLLTLILALPAYCCIRDPSYHFPPFDSFGLLALWAWCGYRLLVDVPSRAREGAEKPPLPHGRGSELRLAAQFAELGTDVGGAHQRLADQHGADAGRA